MYRNRFKFETNPVEEVIALGKRLGARSTPTWFLPNGEKYLGAQPMSKVVPLLDATAQGAVDGIHSFSDGRTPCEEGLF